MAEVDKLLPHITKVYLNPSTAIMFGTSGAGGFRDEVWPVSRHKLMQGVFCCATATLAAAAVAGAVYSNASPEMSQQATLAVCVAAVRFVHVWS